MSPGIYENFLFALVERNLSVCVPSFRYRKMDLLLDRLAEEYKEVVVAGHSSGCTVALNACARSNVKKVILMDPVNTRFNNTKQKFPIPNVNAVLFMNAMKSYSTTFDPFGLPFIPVGVPRLSFLRIRPAILRTRFRCRFTHVDFLNYGHCDILTPAWSNLMHYTRMAVGNRARTLKMFRSYHSAIADAWCDFIA
jgi:pimeloyl-ACP methyl ester carboxylesterase